MSEKLEFTGERFIPGSGGAQIFYEHIHRYLLARSLSQGKVVLDLASGEGYGAALLAAAAWRVFGIELETAVTGHAAKRYAQDNLWFISGDCTKIPCRKEAFDLVVAFEIIEHIGEQEGMLEEIKRVLKPDGALLISTPNKAVYSDEANYTNPFHVREFYVDEFKGLLARHFPQVHLLGQRCFPGSFIWPLGEGDQDTEKVYTVSSSDGPGARPYNPAPMYVIALCSKGGSQIRPCLSSLVDTANGLVEELRQTISQLQAEVDKLARWGRSLDEQLKRKDERILALQREVEELSAWGRRLDEELAARDQRIVKLQVEAEQLASWGKRLDKEIAAKNARIDQLQGEVEELSAWGRRLDAEVKKLNQISSKLIYRALRKLRLLP